MTFVDAWLLFKNGMRSMVNCEPNDFYTALDYEIIHNKYDENDPNLHNGINPSTEEANTAQDSSDSIALVETAKRRKAKDGSITNKNTATM